MDFDTRHESHANSESRYLIIRLIRRASGDLAGFTRQFFGAISGEVGASNALERATGDAATIARLRQELAAQALLIREQEASLAHSRKIFRRASEAARIGVWECTLADESLVWTDGVYDIFEIPRGAPLNRQQTLLCYPEESRRELVAIRSKAIEECSGFTLDTEIITMKGNRRWMRITATIECENGVAARIFGMKQDITEEKILADRTRYLAEFDVMTGLANRAQFQARLSALDEASVDGSERIGALLLVDLDGFKQINDTFGHAFGDSCIKEAAARLAEVCSAVELVARIGGDEFAVLVGPEFGGTALEQLAHSIVEALGRAIETKNGAYHLGASVGVARKGDCSSEQIFTRADTALYAAKASGRNTFRMFDASTMRG
jgi:diguanylate cyclase (GGDEF)-like protein